MNLNTQKIKFKVRQILDYPITKIFIKTFKYSFCGSIVGGNLIKQKFIIKYHSKECIAGKDTPKDITYRVGSRIGSSIATFLILYEFYFILSCGILCCGFLPSKTISKYLNKINKYNIYIDMDNSYVRIDISEKHVIYSD